MKWQPRSPLGKGNLGGSHTTGDTGTQWILDLCNGIVKEGSIPEDWKLSVVLPIYKGKGDPMECGSYTTTTTTTTV